MKKERRENYGILKEIRNFEGTKKWSDGLGTQEDPGGPSTI